MFVNQGAGTSSDSSLISLAYATTPPTNQPELPDTSVRRPATRPPVHDSAVAIRQPATARNAAHDFLERAPVDADDGRPQGRRQFRNAGVERG
jgi:hypothetical protein